MWWREGGGGDELQRGKKEVWWREGGKERRERKEKVVLCLQLLKTVFVLVISSFLLAVAHTRTHLFHLQWTERKTVSPFNVCMIV